MYTWKPRNDECHLLVTEIAAIGYVRWKQLQKAEAHQQVDDQGVHAFGLEDLRLDEASFDLDQLQDTAARVPTSEYGTCQPYLQKRTRAVPAADTGGTWS